MHGPIERWLLANLAPCRGLQIHDVCSFPDGAHVIGSDNVGRFYVFHLM
jgi:hypothetical protein